MSATIKGKKDLESKVWVSRAFMDSSLDKGFTSDVFEKEKYHAVDVMQQNKKGVPFPEHSFPKENYFVRKGKKQPKQPDIFNCGGFWVVSSTCAEVLRSFDLGDGALYPTKLYQFDRETPVEGEYFCLNFGAVKQCFVPEYSPRAVKPNPKLDVWRLSVVPEDDDIAVTRAALDGPDLWVDPDLRNSFFLSDPLVQALKAAKLTRRFGLRRCRVIREV